MASFTLYMEPVSGCNLSETGNKGQYMTNPLRLLQLIRLLDITRLTDNDTLPAFSGWLKALPELPVPAAAFCVYPEYLDYTCQWLAGLNSPSATATVVNFPAGNAGPDYVANEIRQAISAGVDEIDCVLPYQALLRGEYEQVQSFMRLVRQESGEKLLKVIIESGALGTAQQIAKATELAIEGGADFVKTSTGKVAVGVTEEAARIMLTVIAAAGRPVGFKASGGVRTVEQALMLVDLYEEITGKTAVKEGLRIGASALAADIIGRL